MPQLTVLLKYAAHSIIILFIFVLTLWFLTIPVLAPILNPSIQTAGRVNFENSETYISQQGSLINDTAVTASSYLVFNAQTGSVIASRAPRTAVSIASLTKLMTGFLVNKYGQYDQVTTIQPKDVLNISPVLGLQAYENVRVVDLFKAMLIGSANDAALTLGTYLESTRHQPIKQIMNDEALALGMTDTHFSNPLGFDSDTNYSTALDMKKMVEVVRTYPAFNEIDRLLSYTFVSESSIPHSIQATNKLIGADPQIHAVKTGFTDDAQGAMITEIELPNYSFYIIVLHSPNREQDTLTIKKEIVEKLHQGQIY